MLFPREWLEPAGVDNAIGRHQQMEQADVDGNVTKISVTVNASKGKRIR
jgi:hypothetical protein